jgi:hypothetical protein
MLTGGYHKNTLTLRPCPPSVNSNNANSLRSHERFTPESLIVHTSKQSAQKCGRHRGSELEPGIIAMLSMSSVGLGSRPCGENSVFRRGYGFTVCRLLQMPPLHVGPLPLSPYFP